MRIKVADASKRHTLENDRAPINDEMRKVLYAATTKLRIRAGMAIVAFSGCRPDGRALSQVRVEEAVDV